MQDIFLVGDTYYVRYEFAQDFIPPMLWSGKSKDLVGVLLKDVHQNGSCFACILIDDKDFNKRVKDFFRDTDAYMFGKVFTPVGSKPKSPEGANYTADGKLITGSMLGTKAKNLPGIQERVDCPLPPIDYNGSTDCPVKNMPLYEVIMHLNDSHKWPREDIAKWVGSLPFDTTFKKKDSQKEFDLKPIQDNNDLF